MNRHRLHHHRPPRGTQSLSAIDKLHFNRNFRRPCIRVVAAPDRDRGPTAFLDEQLVAAVNMVNMERNMEYRQVVLMTGGEYSRPFRLQWPASTVIYLLADEKAHGRSKAAAKDQQLRVPVGCLLRRVVAKLEGDWESTLTAAGFRGDRLSVWALQGLSMDISDTRNLMTQIGNLAALRSLILGELPTATLEQGRQLLADAGFLANVMSDGAQAAVAEGALTSDVRARRLFTAQQQRLSNAEMDTLDEHRRTRELTDEDFVY